jgi:hypothetical protein
MYGVWMWLFSALSVDNRGLVSLKIGVISNPLKLQCTLPFIVIVQHATVLFVFILNTALLSPATSGLLGVGNLCILTWMLLKIGDLFKMKT